MHRVSFVLSPTECSWADPLVVQTAVKGFIPVYTTKGLTPLWTMIGSCLLPFGAYATEPHAKQDSFILTYFIC